MDSCFKGIREVKDKLYLPNVEDPAQTLEEIAGSDRNVAHFLKNGSLNLPLDTLKHFIFINFEPNNNRETKSSVFTHHDRLITKLYSELLSRYQQILFIYTGRRSNGQKRSIRSVSDYDHQNQRDHTTGIVWIRDEFLLYYTDFSITDEFRKNQSMIFDDVAAEDLGTSQIGTQLNVSMTVTESEDYFVFEMIAKNGNWWIANAKWNDEKLTLNRDISGIYNYSFHCSPTIKLFTCNETVVLKWTNLQIQPNFNSTKGKPLTKFADAIDCVYFFTPGILSGFFVAAVLLIILSLAISFIMDIRTNDRFDHVKSKFAVNVYEE